MKGVLGVADGLTRSNGFNDFGVISIVFGTSYHFLG